MGRPVYTVHEVWLAERALRSPNECLVFSVGTFVLAVIELVPVFSPFLELVPSSSWYFVLFVVVPFVAVFQGHQEEITILEGGKKTQHTLFLPWGLYNHYLFYLRIVIIQIGSTILLLGAEP